MVVSSKRCTAVTSPFRESPMTRGQRSRTSAGVIAASVIVGVFSGE